MSSSKKQMEDFATFIINHPAKESVIERITLGHLDRFRRGDAKVREEVVRMMDSTELFFDELYKIIDENKENINK